MTFSIYTIGYGNHSISNFIQILKEYQIQAVIDVRTTPFSRYRPAFNQKRLIEHLSEAGIGYKHKGTELGGLPKDPLLLTDGFPDYEKIRKTIPYQNGINYLECGIEIEFRIVIMCSCLDYRKCHRHNLIGLDLIRRGYDVIHISKDGKTEVQTTLNF